ncbi:MAG: acetyl-CoA C-acyltransferase [Ilumatobacteraceae bacterium]
MPDIYIAMGQTAENVAESEKVSREDMDEFAKLSQDRAVANQENGFFADEITPLTLPDGTEVSKDDGPRAGTTIEKLASLQPVFRPGGTVTAGNACPLNDGAAAVMVMSDTKAAELGVTPLARIVSSGVTGLNPEIMGLGPIEASRQALGRAGMTAADIDLFEINEAFAAQVIPSAREIGIEWDKLNVHGGGIALGHPFGMTGARIMTTLIHGLQERGAQYGLETMCVGGGQGMAMIVERLSWQRAVDERAKARSTSWARMRLAVSRAIGRSAPSAVASSSGDARPAKPAPARRRGSARCRRRPGRGRRRSMSRIIAEMSTSMPAALSCRARSSRAGLGTSQSPLSVAVR